jgi:ribosomal protein S18 acetylase RimI-like enzyme
MSEHPVTIERVDYGDSRHGAAMRFLLLDYAADVTAASEPMDPGSFDRLPQLLAEFPTAFSVLAFRDQQPVGLTNCFFGFSTFLLRPLVNVHDIMVTGQARGLGVAGLLLGEVERIARQGGCCRITLEVLDENTAARRAYEKFGFDRTPYHPENDTLFLEKQLDA